MDSGLHGDRVAYIVTVLRLPETNVLGGQAHDITLRVNNASSSTAGSDVDTDVMIEMHLQVLTRVGGGLARALTRGTTVGQRGHDAVGGESIYLGMTNAELEK